MSSPYRAKGHIIVDGQEIGETMQCCHCGKHWKFIKGSGADRGYCRFCNLLTCGAKACDPCVPFEKKIELMERNNNNAFIV